MYKSDLSEYRLPEMEDVIVQKIKMKVKDQYESVGKIPGVKLDQIKRDKILKDLQVEKKVETTEETKEEKTTEIGMVAQKAIEQIEAEKQQEKTNGVQTNEKNQSLVEALTLNQNQIVLRQRKIIEPKWHAPWKLKTVISGHNGWVRCLAIDPMNRFFVSGSNDRTIKFWDLASG